MATRTDRSQEKYLVFVYGTLRRGMPNHSLLTGSRCLGLARTRERYALYMEDFPKVVRDEAVSPIQGELYLVDGYTLALLDDLEDHPFLYRREMVPVIMDDGSETPAWLYFCPQAGGVLLPEGDFAAWWQQPPEDEKEYR